MIIMITKELIGVFFIMFNDCLMSYLSMINQTTAIDNTIPSIPIK